MGTKEALGKGKQDNTGMVILISKKGNFELKILSRTERAAVWYDLQRHPHTKACLPQTR